MTTRRAVAIAVPVLVAGLLAGCKTTDSEVVGDGSLTVYEPAGGDWTPVSTANGRYYVKAMEGMADVVSFFVVSSRPGTEGVRSLQDLENVVRTQRQGKTELLKRDVISGVSVISYETVRSDDSGGSGLFQKVLDLKPRPSGYKYATREIGIFALHPKLPGFMVRVGCARTSYHGVIPSTTREDASQFIQQFVADNWFAQQFEENEVFEDYGEAAESYEVDY